MTLRHFPVVLLLLGAGSNLASAQVRTSSVETRPTCVHCTLRLQHLFDIGDENGPGMVDHEDRVVRDSRGRFFLVPSYGTSVRVYDSNGKYLQTLGRKGGGPGEFEGIAAVRITRGDTIRILDNSLFRLSVFGPQLNYLRSTRLGIAPQVEAVVMDDGSAVVSVDSRLPSLIGLPLHLLDTTGRIAQSFGSETGLFRPDIPGLTSRVLARKGGTELWAAHELSYVIERWSPFNAKMSERLVRVASWFPDQERPRSRAWNALRDPPNSRIVYLREDRMGRLWTTISVADPRWKTAVVAKELDHYEIVSGTRYVDLIVEVIDPRTATLIASMRFDSFPYYFVSDSLAAGFPQEKDGKIVLPIYRTMMTDTLARK